MEKFELNKKPVTLKEKLEDLWFDLTYHYPRELRDGWWKLCCFCRNIRKYWTILWNDHDFDFGYMEELIFRKITWMTEYFKVSRIAVGEEEIYHQINLARRVGEIAFGMDYDKEGYDGFIYLGYINTRNFRRFCPKIDTSKEFLSDYRRVKARHLFYKILSQYSSGWWD